MDRLGGFVSLLSAIGAGYLNDDIAMELRCVVFEKKTRSTFYLSDRYVPCYCCYLLYFCRNCL